MKEKTINLPELWMTKKLGDLCDILDKKRKPISKQYRISGKYPYYGATGIVDYVNDYIFSEKLILVGEDGAKWGRGEQTAFAVDGKYWVNNHAHVLKPDRNIIIDSWIIYYFNHLDLSDFITGVTVPKLNQNKLVSIKIPVPPIEEQKRIVQILDKAFEGIAQAEANTRRNLINARELFDSYLNQIFTNQHKNWVTNTLDEICIKITDGKHGDCKNQDHSGYYFLSAKDVKNDRLNYDNARQITKEEFDETNRRTNLEPFDILVTNSGTIGRTAIAPDDPKTYRTTFQKSVAILKPKKEIIDSNFCRFELMANLNKIIAISSGTAQKNLLLRDIRSFHFSMPSNMKEQKKIVSQLTKVLDNSQKLETIYQRKLEAIAELKQSILEKAFTGQLSQ
jgi:type I restriction enzyme S subunit